MQAGNLDPVYKREKDTDPKDPSPSVRIRKIRIRVHIQKIRTFRVRDG